MEVLKSFAAEFQRNIGRYQDLALRQPVAVTRNGRESFRSGHRATCKIWDSQRGNTQ
jgi:hypothetical protein